MKTMTLERTDAPGITDGKAECLAERSFPVISRERLAAALPSFDVDIQVSAHTDHGAGGQYTRATLGTSN